MSTATKEEVKIARKIKQLEKKIRHDSGYLSDDPDGYGARAVAKMEEELSQLKINQLISQLAQLTRERDALRDACELLIAAAPHSGEGVQRSEACQKARSALAMGKVL